MCTTEAFNNIWFECYACHIHRFIVTLQEIVKQIKKQAVTQSLEQQYNYLYLTLVFPIHTRHSSSTSISLSAPITEDLTINDGYLTKKTN